MAAPALVFWERNAPFAAVAASRLAGVPVALTADPKATKDTVAALKFAGGCVRQAGERRGGEGGGRRSCRPPPRSRAAARRAAGRPRIACAPCPAHRCARRAAHPGRRDELSGLPMILRYLARAGAASNGLYGADALASCQARAHARLLLTPAPPRPAAWPPHRLAAAASARPRRPPPPLRSATLPPIAAVLAS